MRDIGNKDTRYSPIRSANRYIKNFLSVVLPNNVIMWKGKRRTNEIAITFDDGPNPAYTEKVLNILQRYNVRATFFLLGCEVEKYPDIARYLVSLGHSIGNHTYSHMYKQRTVKSKLMSEIQETQVIIEQTTGIIPKMFRPPHGRIDINRLRYCKKNGLSTVLWSIDSMDYKKSGTELILRNVNRHTIEFGDIVLFHDDNEYTLEALPIILDNLIERYRFVTVEQMIQI